MVASVEKRVETDDAGTLIAAPILHIRLLGPMTVRRAGVAIALPSSRKLRALLAYLAVAPQPVPRSRLCELLWDVPNDPRGELRWCLSKLRRVLDDPDRRRVETDADTVCLDLSDCAIDVADVTRAASDGIETLDEERAARLVPPFRRGVS